MTVYTGRWNASEQCIGEWVEQFHRDGYLFLDEILPDDWIAELGERYAGRVLVVRTRFDQLVTPYSQRRFADTLNAKSWEYNGDHILSVVRRSLWSRVGAELCALDRQVPRHAVRVSVPRGGRAAPKLAVPRPIRPDFGGQALTA